MQSAKGEIIQEFLLNSPPGQVSDVYNGSIGLTKDIRGIVDDKEEIAQLVPAFEAHNKVQLIPIKLPDADYETATKADADAPTFDEKLTKLRNAIDEAVAEYVSNYYPSGISSVFVSEDNIVIHIVGNKYNPNNFWAGRLRSSWRLSKSNLKGSIKAQIHYYEDGNVQLNSHKESDTDLPSVVVLE
ncbi:F-actin-capping protein subunit alpha [Boothiomyces macroporosus]|uniref:F-actin-capping protein subunit alpha n=1 Tax=Boothiomyces macroporosus TaxID=261099 RepID=A0AAD5Y6L1_9FUNG|nr:F-actin-capping protein subunit alpha [Boothiomyces macroporosus]